MARRAKPHEEELPFVALMDTMTNVVGVLIIVLVMIGIGLAKSVQKVLSELPMVSEVEHDKLKSELGEFDSKRDPAEVEAEIAKLRESIQKTIEAMKPMEEAESKNPVVVQNLEELQKKLEAARKEREQRKALLDQMLAKIDQLKLKLDTTPAFTPPAPIAVRLPNTRPMPEKAELKRVLVTEGRIMFLKNDEFLEALEEEFKKENTAYMVRSQTLKDGNGKPVVKKGRNGQSTVQKNLYFDPAKLTKFFSKGQLGNRDLQVNVLQNPNSASLQMKLIPKPNGGESVEQVRKGNSTFRYELNQLKTDSKAVVWFLVCKDSIAAYLGARDVVDAEGVPVGWEIYENPSFSQPIPGNYLADYTPPPPPATAGAAPPPAKPAGPPPVRIAAPKAALD